MVEGLTIRGGPFLSQAGVLFAAHPIRDVRLSDLKILGLRPGGVAEVRVTPYVPQGDFWPIHLFPEYEPWEIIRYKDAATAIADLARRAAGYGRRRAGIRIEPPPLPPVKVSTVPRLLARVLSPA
jgi:hypothetical protein